MWPCCGLPFWSHFRQLFFGKDYPTLIPNFDVVVGLVHQMIKQKRKNRAGEEKQHKNMYKR